MHTVVHSKAEIYTGLNQIYRPDFRYVRELEISESAGQMIAKATAIIPPAFYASEPLCYLTVQTAALVTHPIGFCVVERYPHLVWGRVDVKVPYSWDKCVLTDFAINFRKPVSTKAEVQVAVWPEDARLDSKGRLVGRLQFDFDQGAAVGSMYCIVLV